MKLIASVIGALSLASTASACQNHDIKTCRADAACHWNIRALACQTHHTFCRTINYQSRCETSATAKTICHWDQGTSTCVSLAEPTTVPDCMTMHSKRNACSKNHKCYYYGKTKQCCPKHYSNFYLYEDLKTKCPLLFKPRGGCGAQSNILCKDYQNRGVCKFDVRRRKKMNDGTIFPRKTKCFPVDQVDECLSTPNGGCVHGVCVNGLHGKSCRCNKDGGTVWSGLLCDTPVSHDTLVELCQQAKVDVHILVDGSGSVTQSDWLDTLDFARTLISPMELGPDKIRVAISQWSSGFWNYGIYPHFLPYMDDKASVNSAINSITKYSYGTDTRLAITKSFEIYQDFARDDVGHVIIFLTDGMSGNGVDNIDLLHVEGVEVYAIGVGSGAYIPEMEQIASTPTDHYTYRVQNYVALEAIQHSVIQDICSTVPKGQDGFRSGGPSGVGANADVPAGFYNVEGEYVEGAQ